MAGFPLAFHLWGNHSNQKLNKVAREPIQNDVKCDKERPVIIPINPSILTEKNEKYHYSLSLRLTRILW